MPGKWNEEKDERVKLPLDPETALRALLAVDPERHQRTKIRTAATTRSAANAYQATSAHTV